MRAATAFCVLAALSVLSPPRIMAQGAPTGMPNALNVNVTNTPLPVTVQNSQAAPVVVSVVPAATQLGQIVNLTSSSNACPGGFAGARKVDLRRLSNGDRTENFAIPAGASLVITALTFNLISAREDQNVLVRLGIPCGDACMVPIVEVTVKTDTFRAQGSTHMTFPEGVVVDAGTILCSADVNHGGHAFAHIYGRLVTH